ncbi:MAG: LLM class flavin-dependent oxidoreductase [Ectothiorhodospiraceae bacterium]|nr:LLM class flavin-dependent oxidoreductase [Ectothiorhodospiraceae bacterium]
MTTTLPLRFGLCTDQNLSFPTLVERWQLFERMGFDSVWDCDHFNQTSNETGPYFEGWTTLAALAARTERIRVGVLVSCNTFRHPGLLAQMAMTVDHVSNGRLELGIGAGYTEGEHGRFGIELPSPGERRRRFREAVQIVDSLLRNESTTFDGRYYQLKGAYVRPRPIQTPRPPLTLGAHGPMMLRVCAELADTWNSLGSVEEIAERNRILDQHCADLGRDPASLRRSFYGWSSQMKAQGLPDFWSSVGAFEEVVGRYREVGISEFILDQPRDDQFDVLEKVVADVLPGLRAASAA